MTNEFAIYNGGSSTNVGGVRESRDSHFGLSTAVLSADRFVTVFSTDANN